MSPSLPPKLSDPFAIIGREAEKLMNIVVDVYDPDSANEIPYDSETDTGGYTPLTLVLTTKARMQHLRVPHEANIAGEWVTKRAIRFQIPLANGHATYPDEGTLPDSGTYPSETVFPSFGGKALRKGFVVRVQGSVKQPYSVTFGFIVLSVINSSHAAVCTIECMSELTELPRVA